MLKKIFLKIKMRQHGGDTTILTVNEKKRYPFEDSNKKGYHFDFCLNFYDKATLSRDKKIKKKI